MRVETGLFSGWEWKLKTVGKEQSEPVLSLSLSLNLWRKQTQFFKKNYYTELEVHIFLFRVFVHPCAVLWV